MNLSDFAGELRRRWKLFAAVVVVCALAAALLALLVPNRYTSSVRLLVTSIGSTTSSAYESLQLEAARTRSYVTLVASEVIAQRVVDDLGLTESAHEVASGVNGVISADTNIIDVTVTGDTPAHATAIADSLGRQFVQYSAAVETPVGSDNKKVLVRTLGSATPASAQRPGPLVFGVLGGLIGVVLGASAVWIRGRTDRVVRTPRDVKAATGLRVFWPVGGETESARESEVYRGLATRARAVGGRNQKGAPAWLIVSAGDPAASESVAIGLATVIATNDAPVLIVDTRGGADSSVASVAKDVAFAAVAPEVLQDTLATERCRGGPILVIGPGADTPDSTTIAGLVDAVIIVAEAGHTRRRNLTDATDDVRLVGATFAGIVLREDPIRQSNADSTHNGAEGNTSRPSTRGSRHRLLAERSNDVG